MARVSDLCSSLVKSEPARSTSSNSKKQKHFCRTNIDKTTIWRLRMKTLIWTFQDDLRLRSVPPLTSLAAGRFLTSADKLPSLNDWLTETSSPEPSFCYTNNPSSPPSNWSIFLLWTGSFYCFFALSLIDWCCSNKYRWSLFSQIYHSSHFILGHMFAVFHTEETVFICFCYGCQSWSRGCLFTRHSLPKQGTPTFFKSGGTAFLRLAGPVNTKSRFKITLLCHHRN